MKLCIHVRPREDGQGWAVDVFDGRRAWTKTHLGESPLNKAEAHRLVEEETDTPICSVCARPTGFGDEDRGEPPVNLARCPAPGGTECRAVAQAVAPWRRENETLRSNCDHLSSENASLASQNESMAMRIESLADELAKPEDVRLREVLDALDGRAVIFDGLGARVGHLLDEMDEWIGRAGEAERAVDEWKAANGYNDLLAAYSASVSEADRLRKLFDDAGQGEHNVLALIDHYQRNSMDADERIRAVRKLLEENGCDCPCDHHPDERGDDCEVCLACRIGEAVGK